MTDDGQSRNTVSTPSRLAATDGESVGSLLTTSTPSGRFARSGERVSARTGTPAAASSVTTCRPTLPVAPVTRIFACVMRPNVRPQ